MHGAGDAKDAFGPPYWTGDSFTPILVTSSTARPVDPELEKAIRPAQGEKEREREKRARRREGGRGDNWATACILGDLAV